MKCQQVWAWCLGPTRQKDRATDMNFALTVNVCTHTNKNKVNNLNKSNKTKNEDITNESTKWK